MSVAGEQNPFKVGDRVNHERWGAGHVTTLNGDKVAVTFASGGLKQINHRFLTLDGQPSTVGKLVSLHPNGLPTWADFESESKKPRLDAKVIPIAQPKPAYLAGISAADLMAKHFEPVNYVVPGLIAEGATLFAGAPKIGKSWMAYDFALAIAAGRPVFGSIPVTQGDVLYMALEDSQRRLKARLLKKGIHNPPERLTLVTDWPDLDNGCVAELEAWADAVERPTLVIVDVLKMVRTAQRANESVYEADYRSMVGLGQFARSRGIAVIVVHHVRKAASDDPLESVSGTNGLTGAADSVMVLKRDIGTANCILYVRGRDVEESEKAVRFEAENGTWNLLGAASEVGRTSEREAIMSVLRRHEEPLKAPEIADILGKSAPAIRKTLSRMWDAGEIQKTSRGRYTCHNSHNVTKTPQSDNETDVTGGGCEEEEEEDGEGWIGETPKQTRDRVRRWQQKNAKSE